MLTCGKIKFHILNYGVDSSLYYPLDSLAWQKMQNTLQALTWNIDLRKLQAIASINSSASGFLETEDEWQHRLQMQKVIISYLLTWVRSCGWDKEEGKTGGLDRGYFICPLLLLNASKNIKPLGNTVTENLCQLKKN